MTPRNQRLALLVIVLAGMAVHASSLRAAFTADDFAAIVRHPGVTGPLSPSTLLGLDWFGRAFDAPNAVGTFRPVVTFTFWIDQHVGRGSALPFHVTNLLLYGALIALLDRFLRRLAGDALSAPGRLVALAVFATMTIHVDVVPSASTRSELLATLLSVVALDLALEPLARPGRAALFVLALLGAMLSKESALPVAVLAPVLAARRMPRRRVVPLALASLAALGAVFALRVGKLPLAPTSRWELHNPLIGRAAGDRLLGAADVLTHYLEHAIAPADLCFDYGYAAIVPGHGLTLRAAVGVAIVAALVALLVTSFRKRPVVTDALLGLGASYVVVSHVLVPASAIVADRWFFFPSFWLVAALVALVDGAASARLRPILAGAGVLFAAGQGVVTTLASAVWRDDPTLAAYSVRAHPNALGVRLLQIASSVNEGKPEETAWALLVAGAIYAMHPEPIPPDTFPASWEDEPALERVGLLRAKLGPARFAVLRDAAIGEALSRGYPEAAEVLRALAAQ